MKSKKDDNQRVRRRFGGKGHGKGTLYVRVYHMR